MAPAPLRPRRLRRARPDSLARPAAQRGRDPRPGRVHGGGAHGRHHRPRRASGAARRARGRRRARPGPLARRAEPRRSRAGPHPGRRQRPLERGGPVAAGRRAGRLLRLGRHGVRPAAPAAPRRAHGPALPGLVVGVGAAPGAAGRALPRGSMWNCVCISHRVSTLPSQSRTARGTAPSAAGSSGWRDG